MVFDSINTIEVSICYILAGIFLFSCSLIFSICFLCYTELRTGVYQLIVGSSLSEVFFGFHLLINGIYSLARIISNEPIDKVYCKAEGFIVTIFLLLWVLQNIIIIILFYQRKLAHSTIAKLFHIIALVISLIISGAMYFDNAVGESITGSCFISESKSFLIIIIVVIFYIEILLAILYNIWFFKFRNKSVDRSIINGYNYYVLFTSFVWSGSITNIIIFNFSEKSSVILHAISILIPIVLCIYIGFFRLQVEYVQIILSLGHTNSKFFNAILLIFGCYKRPKFKEIKKVLNVKYIESLSINDSKDTIFSHIKDDFN